MPLTPDELEHMADEGEGRAGVRIKHTVHCGVCGYNLKSLPVTYTCPECGNSYSARPLKMFGVFQPGNETFPGGRIATVVLCGIIGAVLFGAGIKGKHALHLGFGGLFLVITAVLVVITIGEIQSFLRAKSIRNRIEEEKRENRF